MSAKLHPIARQIAVLSRSGYPLIWVITHEEERAVALVRASADAGRRRYSEWSVARGFGNDDGVDHDPKAAVESIARTEEPAIFALLDFHPYLDRPGIVRRIRESLPRCHERRQSVVFIAPTLAVPRELEKDCVVLDLPLPDAKEQLETLRAVAASEKIELSPEVEPRAVRSALGLTTNQASRVFRKVMVLRRGLREDDLALVVEEKKDVLRRTDALEFNDLAESIEDVGGLGEMKRWLATRTAAFGDEARAFGLPPPKGLLLLGVQGCGKSLSAKAVAHFFKFPLLRLDVGALFSSGGSPEGSLRHAMKVAESLAPVVLWVDEIEKGFAGGGQSEVSTRAFGSFITWLSEKKAHVFVVATANEVAQLPPELLRRGRFDEVFFVDLPNPHERLEILKIHLRRRSRDPVKFAKLAAVAEIAEYFSGAELEQVVISGLYSAFSEGRELAEQDLVRAAKQTVPLYRTYEEKIKALREWARQRARPATLDTTVLDLFDAGQSRA